MPFPRWLFARCRRRFRSIGRQRPTHTSRCARASRRIPLDRFGSWLSSSCRAICRSQARGRLGSQTGEMLAIGGGVNAVSPDRRVECSIGSLAGDCKPRPSPKRRPRHPRESLGSTSRRHRWSNRVRERSRLASCSRPKSNPIFPAVDATTRLAFAVLNAILLNPTPTKDCPLAADVICVQVAPPSVERRIPTP